MAKNQTAGLHRFLRKWIKAQTLQDHMSARRELHHIVAVEVAGEVWSCVTNVHVLVGARGEAAGAVAPCFSEASEAHRALAPESNMWAEAPRAALLKFAGDAKLPTKTWEPTMRPGWIVGERVDLVYVAQLLGGVTDHTVRLSSRQFAEGPAIHISGDAWRASVMCLRASGALANEPRFTAETAARAATPDQRSVKA